MSLKNLNRLLAAMACTISCLTLLLMPPDSAAQGSTFTFNNRIPGVVDAPIYGPEPSNPTDCRSGNTSSGFPPGAQTYGGERLLGTSYTAELWVGPSGAPEDAFVPVTPRTTFQTSPALAGYVVPVTIAVPAAFPPASPIQVQVRVWDNRAGPSWAEAIPHGKSAVWIVTVPNPTPVPPPTWAMAGLRSFNLCEPPQRTDFSYEGHLSLAGGAVSGFFDFQFTLYETPTGGDQLGPVNVRLRVPVVNGVFKVTLDFGPVFDGSARWLEIAVRDASVVPLLPFTTLAPRQLITPAPYATFAPFAGTAAVAQSLAGGIVFNTNLANGAVTGFAIASGAVGSVHLGDSAVTTAKIEDGTILAPDIGNGEVVKSLNGLRDHVTLQAGANISLATVGNTLQISGAGGSGGTGWSLTGNSGTAPGVNFVGTTDNQALEFKVNGNRALRLEPSTNSPSVIGGFRLNSVSSGVKGATIGGGGGSSEGGPFIFMLPNRISADYGTIGGGINNWIKLGAEGAAIGGGGNHVVSTNAGHSAIAGGSENRIGEEADFTAIGGGLQNTIGPGADYSTIGGGLANTNVGPTATIAGGEYNAIEENGFYATISGGMWNRALSYASTIGGGRQNIAGPGANESTISGGHSNVISTNALRATIGGGEYNAADSKSATISGGSHNSVETYMRRIDPSPGDIFPKKGFDYELIPSPWSTVGGGSNNLVSGSSFGTIGGGQDNSIAWAGSASTIAGGRGNLISGWGSGASAIGGGVSNHISSSASQGVVAGGEDNSVVGDYGTIPGGYGNEASDYSFAAGYRASAQHSGSFVWADAQGPHFSSTAPNQVSFRCLGGVRFSAGYPSTPIYEIAWTPGSGGWSLTSDRNAKENLEALDSQAVLEKVAQLPITEWNYKGFDQRHVGPMAQDFHALFPFSTSDTTLNSADLDGIALAAIQGLNRKLDGKNATLEKEVAELKALVKSLAEKVNGGGQ